MDLNKLMGYGFNIFFVIVLILIILYSLRIMSKDVGRKDKKNTKNEKANEKPVAPVAKINKSKPVEERVVNKPAAKVASPTRKPQAEEKRSFGLKVESTFAGSKFKAGAVIPMRNITTLGRKEENSIVLSDKFVSSNHAKIYVKDGAIILEDLNSTNGTFVNEQRISGKIRVGINDEIRLGSTVFKIVG